MIKVEGIIFAIILILIILYFIVRALYIAFVNENSILLSTIKDINKEYTFYPFVNYDQTHTYDNEIFYREISEEDYLIYQLQFLSSEIYRQIGLMDFNKNRFSKYINRLEPIKAGGKYNKNTKGYIVKLLNYYEQKAYKKEIQAPKTEYSIKITLCLSTINGQIYRKKTRIFNSSEIKRLMERLKNRNGIFYNDRGIWCAISKVERGKVSNKMRFAIYRRDNYRCRYCHRSQSITTLEVDHIVPIAKGGKTTFNNLQTLCHDCNVAKGDRI